MTPEKQFPDEIRMRVRALNNTPLGCVKAAGNILRGRYWSSAYPNRADASAQLALQALGGASNFFDFFFNAKIDVPLPYRGTGASSTRARASLSDGSSLMPLSSTLIVRLEIGRIGTDCWSPAELPPANATGTRPPAAPSKES